jgi:hypothetical protein
MSLRAVAAPVAMIVAVLATAAVALAQDDEAKRRYQPVYFAGKALVYEPAPLGRQTAPLRAQTPLYQVSYPREWRAVGLRRPQCAPCDHAGDGVTWEDWHDHVAGDGPREVGRRPKWRVFGVVPASTGDAERDAAITRTYARLLPARSEIEVQRLMTTVLPDGTPVARMSDLGFYFVAPYVGRRVPRDLAGGHADHGVRR